MKNVIFLLFLTFMYGCGNRSQNMKVSEIIPVNTDNVNSEATSFIKKIEVVPLETIDSLSLMKGCRKVIFDSEMNLFVILDNRFIVYVFSADGKFISSSEAKQGPGPEQYQLIVDIKFNPYENGIDLLNPYGMVYTYDKYFNFIRKKKITANQNVFSKFIAYSKDKYMLTPPNTIDNPMVCWIDYSCDSIVGKDYYNRIISIINMDNGAFHKVNDEYYFIPIGIDYYFYKLDMKKYQLLPFIKLDFGKEEIKEEDLPGGSQICDSGTERSLKASYEEMQERVEYLEKSSCILPLIKFFNEKYVYVHFIKNRKPSNYIYDRLNNEGFLQSKDAPLAMPFCFCMDEDNVLYSIQEPFDLMKYVNDDFMSEETLRKIQELNEDDNPVIIKYHLW